MPSPRSSSETVKLYPPGSPEIEPLQLKKDLERGDVDLFIDGQQTNDLSRLAPDQTNPLENFYGGNYHHNVFQRIIEALLLRNPEELTPGELTSFPPKTEVNVMGNGNISILTSRRFYGYGVPREGATFKFRKKHHL